MNECSFLRWREKGVPTACKSYRMSKVSWRLDDEKNTNAVSHFTCYITPAKAGSEAGITIPVFIATVITRQTPGGKTKRMGAAAKKYNSKMTLLSIYKQRLGGFTSSGKQVLARGGAINGRFRFFFFCFRRRRWAEWREGAGLAREEQSVVGGWVGGVRLT